MSIFKEQWLDSEPSAADKVRARIMLGQYPSSLLIVTAYTLAGHAHQGQTDKAGVEYIAHPQRVAMSIHFGGHDAVCVALGWLHDVVEDTGLSLDEVIAAFRLSAGADYEQSDLDRLRVGLEAITHRPNEPRADYYARVKTSPEAMVVKYFDIEDNTSPSRMAQLDDATQTRLAVKYAKARLALGFR